MTPLVWPAVQGGCGGYSKLHMCLQMCSTVRTSPLTRLAQSQWRLNSVIEDAMASVGLANYYQHKMIIIILITTTTAFKCMF